MPRNQIIATWLSFMITAFRQTTGLSVAQFIKLDRNYGLVRFLAKNYELLHYYDTDYVINDVKTYISGQGGNIREAA